MKHLLLPAKYIRGARRRGEGGDDRGGRKSKRELISQSLFIFYPFSFALLVCNHQSVRQKAKISTSSDVYHNNTKLFVRLYHTTTSRWGSLFLSCLRMTQEEENQ